MLESAPPGRPRAPLAHLSTILKKAGVEWRLYDPSFGLGAGVALQDESDPSRSMQLEPADALDTFSIDEADKRAAVSEMPIPAAS